ncbi:MAG: hypothetical protein AABY22_13860, partial [Nanoarchaeota archaeon]
RAPVSIMRQADNSTYTPMEIDPPPIKTDCMSKDEARIELVNKMQNFTLWLATMKPIQQNPTLLNSFNEYKGVHTINFFRTGY